MSRNHSRNREAFFYVNAKDFHRVLFYKDKDEFEFSSTFEEYLSDEAIKTFYDTHDWWYHDAYLVFSEKETDLQLLDRLEDSGHSFNKIASYSTNSKKTKKKVAYYHKLYTPFLFANRNQYKGTGIETVINNGVLKTYNSTYEFYVFQVGKELYWIIGYPLDRKTLIIYNLYTNEPELLPEKKISYGFDSRDFIIGSSKQLEKVDNYYIFKDIIPEDYPITKIRVGLKNESLFWTRFFYLDK